ncbi:MAG TPA: hypothetical protein PKK23_21505 [Nitrospirales bacterium]|nr:hypothetical protein [Nitrospiraceae bacterium]HNP31638.1 hypothetical protein [Nitrospirales bacterium]
MHMVESFFMKLVRKSVSGFCFFRVAAALIFIGLFSSISWADDPFGSSTLAPNKNDMLKDMAFDQVNWKRPQGVFTWITMARGYETPWDSLGRPGWMTTDAYVQPVDPGVSEFSSDTQMFYIVFEAQPLDAPGQFAVAWFDMNDGQVTSNTPIGKDVIELEMNQRSGYFQVSQPADGWKPGKYQVKIFYGAPGQALHAVNVIGTMEFTIKE